MKKWRVQAALDTRWSGEKKHPTWNSGGGTGNRKGLLADSTNLGAESFRKGNARSAAVQKAVLNEKKQQ